MTDLIDLMSRQISFKIELDTARVAAAFEAMRESWERMAASLQISGRYTLIGPGSWVIHHGPYQPETEPCPLPDITIEFGPLNWIHEIRRIPVGMQFPRPWPRLFVSPIECEVDTHWPQFTALNFPIPARLGYDFTRCVPADEPNVWAAPPPAVRHHTRRPATARRAPRRGRTRR